MRKRYHVMIIREDGKQVHNRVLEWFPDQAWLTFAGSAAGLVVASVAGVFLMAAWTGNLIRHNHQLQDRGNNSRPLLASSPRLWTKPVLT